MKKAFSTSTYINRRVRLKQNFSKGILLFLGNELSPMNYQENTYPFRQDSTFLYFFGLNQPSLAAIIDLEKDREILFGDDPSMDMIIWMGNRAKLASIAERFGIFDIQPFRELNKYIGKAKKDKRLVYYLPPYRADSKLRLSKLLEIEPEEINNKASVDFIKAVIAQREIKTAAEIKELEESVNISIDMHTNAMQYTKPGMSEAQVAAEVHRTALAKGADISFPIIATINGQILHNHDHENVIQEGDIFLLDAGAQTKMGYAGDLSSSFPVAKRFTTKQKEIYQIVFQAHRDAVALLKTGIKFIDVHKMACRSIIEGLKAIDLMKGDTEEALKRGAHALFFPCGAGHMLGLDVHDMENLGENWVGYDNEKRSHQFGLKSLRLAKELKPGFVLTIEPGIYFIPELIERWSTNKTNESFLNYGQIKKFKDFGGIRNEENFVITRKGSRILGKHFPKTLNDIEALRQ